MENADFLVLMATANPFSNVFMFIFGTLLGSFLNVCIARMPVGKSIVAPGSACGSCGVPLLWWHNIPIVSYIALRGHCYFCRSVFSARYLLMELLCGGLTLVLWWHFNGAHYPFFYYLVFTGLLVIVFFIDLDAWIILDEINYFGIVAGLIGSYWLRPQFYVLEEYGWNLQRLPAGFGNVLWAAIGAVVGFAFFYSIGLLGSMMARQEAMGRGDMKLAAMIGAFLGLQKAFLALMLSFPLGAVVAIPMLVLRRKSGKTPVPFGTFMAVAAYLCILYGDRFTEWMSLLTGRYTSYY
jgi:leader peptidase (prepilin peptidase)/N-methyltransferase